MNFAIKASVTEAFLDAQHVARDPPMKAHEDWTPDVDM
jgi:hypothetical protein